MKGLKYIIKPMVWKADLSDNILTLRIGNMLNKVRLVPIDIQGSPIMNNKEYYLNLILELSEKMTKSVGRKLN